MIMLLSIRGELSPSLMPPPPVLVPPARFTLLFLIMLCRIVGEDSAIKIPPPSTYDPALCSSGHNVPVPAVRVNPWRTAVLSSPEMISTQLPVSENEGVLPLII